MFNNELFLLRFGKYMKQLLSIKEKALKIVKSVRGSTAAGINISLLPRDCRCGKFACSAVWEETSFWCLLDFRYCCLGKRPFPWHLRHSAFLAFGIFGIWRFWYFGDSAHSVPERASCGTEYACGAQNSLLGYAVHFLRHSV